MKHSSLWILSGMGLLLLGILFQGAALNSKAKETQQEHLQAGQLKSTRVKTSPTTPVTNSQYKGVSDTRVARLTKGINVSHWFAQAPLTPENFQTSITPEDIRRIRGMGFRHVRLPLDPNVLFNEGEPESLNSKNLAYFDRAIDMIQAQDLAVIVDLHPEEEFKQRLYSDPAFVNSVAKFWRTLARHLSRRNPERVFLEVLNEPATQDPQDWYAIQRKLLAAMREGAPAHTLIAASNLQINNKWDNVLALKALTPVKDPNVVYTFHFYEPMLFTHQGATWGWEMLRYFRSVPYPSSTRAVLPILPAVKNQDVKGQLQYYGQQQWQAKKLEGPIRDAAAWAKTHKVHLTCNEFGVYRSFAPPAARNAWIRDVRSLLEKHQIGWTMWDYNQGFGVARKVNGKTIPDPQTLQALFKKVSN